MIVIGFEQLLAASSSYPCATRSGSYVKTNNYDQKFWVMTKILHEIIKSSQKEIIHSN
jgi:hypothetical protein